jgi:hypothetical protein
MPDRFIQHRKVAALLLRQRLLWRDRPRMGSFKIEGGRA